jgi:hypothetical protein
MAFTITGTVFWLTATTVTGTGGALGGKSDFFSEQAGKKARDSQKVNRALRANDLSADETG